MDDCPANFEPSSRLVEWKDNGGQIGGVEGICDSRRHHRLSGPGGKKKGHFCMYITTQGWR